MVKNKQKSEDGSNSYAYFYRDPCCNCTIILSGSVEQKINKPLKVNNLALHWFNAGKVSLIFSTFTKKEK